MLDLSPTPAQEMLKSNARDFVTRQCPRETVREIDESELGFSPELWRQISEMGWVGSIVPEAYGGSDNSLADLGVILEEMGWACMPSPLHSSGVLGALAILAAGNEDQKRTLLPAVAAGERILSFAYTEPDYGWSPNYIKLAATRSDRGYVLNGTKLLVPDAQVADMHLVVTRTGEANVPGAGLTVFLVDRGTPGLTVRQISGWTGDRLNEMVFDNTRLPESAVLGEVDGAWRFLEPVLDQATIALCAYMVGGMQRMMDMSIEYSQQRIAFGVPIGTFQRVQDMVINIVNDLEGARWLTYEALWKVDEEFPRDEQRASISRAKAACSDGFARCTENAHYVHGGVSVDKRYGLYLFTKKSRTLLSYLGDPHYHRKRLARHLRL